MLNFVSMPRVFRAFSFFSKMSIAVAQKKPSPSSSTIVRFYDPQVYASDPLGRDLNTILSWSDNELEYCHNYIQYLFPIPEQSTFNFFAPVIDEESYLAFRQRSELRASLKRSYIRMLAFYGFELNENLEEVYVSRTPRFDKPAKTWVRRFDHNHLRLTRILRSLRVLGLAMEAEALWRALDEVCKEQGIISKKSHEFWTRAAKRALHLAPEDDEDEDQSAGLLSGNKYAAKSWLSKYENIDDGNDNNAVEKQDEQIETEKMTEADREKATKKRKRSREEGS